MLKKVLKKVLEKVDSRQAGRRVPAGFDDNQAVDNVRLPDHLRHSPVIQD